MSQQHCHFDASRSLTALEQDSTIIAVIEMSQSKWLVAALVPSVERQPLKKLEKELARMRRRIFSTPRSLSQRRHPIVV